MSLAEATKRDSRRGSAASARRIRPFRARIGSRGYRCLGIGGPGQQHEQHAGAGEISFTYS